MKYIRVIYFVLISFIYTNAQTPCTSVFATDYLNTNALNAHINAAGDMFADIENQIGLEVYNDSDSTTMGTIFQAGLVMGGINSEGKERVAWRSYGYPGSESDHATGHLANDLIDDTHCDNWNQIWRVEGIDIRLHLAEIATYGVPQVRRSSLYDYPAVGNPFFTDYHNFSLPKGIEFAPFYDANNDAIYNPDNGDYPLPTNVNPVAIPDLLLWSTYNNAASLERYITWSERLNLEVQQTTFAYACSSNNLLNKTLFTQHKIINRTEQRWDSLFIGNRLDLDIGNSMDDCVGTAAEFNTFYSYNCDAMDGDDRNSGSFNRIESLNLPVQATTFLNQSLDRTRGFWRSGLGVFNPRFQEPGHQQRLYYALNGNWSDNSPQTYGGFGYQEKEGKPTPFIFSDSPTDENGWSMLDNHNPSAEHDGMMSHYVGDFLPGAIVQLDQAWSIHRGENGNHLSNVDLMYEQIPQIQAWYDDGFANLPCLVSNTEIIDQQTEVMIYPNPTTSIVQVSMPAALVQSIDIFDSYGHLLKTIVATNIDLSEQTMGVYFLKIEMKSGELITRKIIKL